MSAGRNRREGVLHIDGVEVGITTAPGNAYSLNVKKPYYFGGINQTESEEVLEKAVKNLAVRLLEFKVQGQNNGCLCLTSCHDFKTMHTLYLWVVTSILSLKKVYLQTRTFV